LQQTVAKGKIILVVEDEPGIAKAILRILSTEGFEVDIAVNGEIALEMWKRKNYDLCISDINMPRMNGIELFRQLANEYPDAIKKFIFMTEDPTNGRIKAFMEENGRPCLSKPFLPENLIAVVKKLLVMI
jgi:CheY-like chemotaxis protein